MRFLMAVFGLFAFALPAAAQVITPSEMLRSSVTNFIRPQAGAFASRTDALVSTMETLCATLDAETLAAAKAGFAETALAFARIEFLRIGPLMEENRAERILFWPDRRSIGLRQVQAIIAEADEGPTSLETLETKSVAAQGLGALEFVLFGTGSESLESVEGDFRCRYGRTIALNLQGMATEIVASWTAADGIATRLTQPGPDYPDYRTTTESLEAIVGLVSHGIEGVRDTKLNPFIARDDREANPRLAIYWRSDLTIASLRANIEGMRGLVALSGVATDPALAAEIEAAFGSAFDALDAVGSPIEQAVTDPDQAAALKNVVAATQELQQLIGEELSATLGLSVGFSSLDGD
jgi:uncharacterized protein